VVELIEKSPGRIQEKKEAIRKLEVQHLDD
jgi:hypothetical protein